MTTKAASEIVIGPVITERTYLLSTQGRYTFKVLGTASKTEIKKALEAQCESQGIQVKEVNSVTMRGKRRRSFRALGSGQRALATAATMALCAQGRGQKG